MGEYARLNKMLQEEKEQYEELKNKKNRTVAEDDALIDLYLGIGEIEGALLEMADVDGLDDPGEAFDYHEEDSIYEEPPITLKDLDMGDFVLLGDGSVRQVLHNPMNGGLSLYNNNYACLAYLSDYTETFEHKRIDLFTIHKVLSKDAYEDDYRRVAVSFVTGSKLSQKIIDSISWTWEREEDLPLSPNPVTM